MVFGIFNLRNHIYSIILSHLMSDTNYDFFKFKHTFLLKIVKQLLIVLFDIH